MLRSFGMGVMLLAWWVCAPGCAVPEAEPPLRNMIVVIGDGMGPQQVGLLELYARHAESSIYGERPTTLSTIAGDSVIGLSTPVPEGALVIDSACAATQIAGGVSCRAEMVGMDAGGNPAITVVDLARQRGMKVGLISDVRLTHATPAAFVAHQPHRRHENRIAHEMIGAGVDLLLAGGLRHFVPDRIDDADRYRAGHGIPAEVSVASRREDAVDLLDTAAAAGYRLAFSRGQLASIDGLPLLGLFAGGAMRDGIQEHLGRLAHEPSLVEMTTRALELLGTGDEGFFLMVEAGQIDWAGHDNDAGRTIHEMIKLDATLQVIHEWMAGRDDTLLVVLADHETGGLGVSYTRSDIPLGEGGKFDPASDIPRFNFGDPGVLDRMYDQRLSFEEIFVRFDGLESGTAEDLRRIVNEALAFEITLDEARRLLQDEPNKYFIPGHKYLKYERFPAVDDFEEFYVFHDDLRRNLLARALAREQQVAWSTGTHTHTPVPVLAHGPDRLTSKFGGLHDHVHLGRILKSLLDQRGQVSTLY